MLLAKSYPFKESIYEHTDNLLKKLEVLKNLYGDKININWKLLEQACIYHDLGKVNRVFQARIKGGDIDKALPNIPHGYLSILFIDYRKLIEKYKFTIEELVLLINVVAYHHKREPLDDEMKESIKNYYPYLLEDLREDRSEELDHLEDDLNLISLEIVSKSGISDIPKKLVGDYVLLKGLLNKIDYSASGHYEIEYPNNFLVKSMENIKKKWGENAEFNELQKYMIKNQDENIVAIAETGYGKTEAGLLWIGNNKGFFTLPLKSAINQTYTRIVEDIVLCDVEKRVGLLHSETLAEYVGRNRDILDESLLDYQEITNELSMPLTICTIDQIFDFVYKYVGFERKLATLSYSKIVIDEIQMYSADLVAYIIIALTQITKLGGRFSIITATFPPFIKDLLEENNINFKMPSPFLYNNRLRHSIKIKRDEINGEYIYSKFKDNKILVIVNTVKKLNEIHDDLVNNLGFENVNVFHSGFTRMDRDVKEKKIVEFGQRNNDESGIWICTQVAEASLDIDFDLLITELSDLNGLFQRMGRCYRNRKLDRDYNIYVFDGGENLCSGVGYVNDKDIFNMSKKLLRDRGDGEIDEREKIELINRLYSTNSLKDTKYFMQIQKTIEYIDAINYEEFKKVDVSKYFRNISSVNVIPRPVYENNYEEINRLIDIINSYEDNEYLDRKKARLDLNRYKLSIPYYLVNKNNVEVIDINKYEAINIYKCEYSNKYGIRHLEEAEKEELDIFF